MTALTASPAEVSDALARAKCKPRVRRGVGIVARCPLCDTPEAVVVTLTDTGSTIECLKGCDGPALAKRLGLEVAKAGNPEGAPETKTSKAQTQSGAVTRTLIVDRACDIKPEAVRWLWNGRVPLAKLTLLEGQPGLGKTLAALDLAARVSAGLVMPLHSVPPPDGCRDVIIMSYEDDAADTIRPRLEAAGADLTRCHIIRCARSTKDGDSPVVLPEDLPLLAGEIRRLSAVLVVVDPLMAALSGSIDAHKDQDVRRALSRMRDLAESTGAAIVLIRHLRKATVGAAVLAGQGSIGIVGAARAAHLVAADPDDAECRILAPVKMNVGRPLPAVRFRIADRSTTGGIEAPCVAWLGECDATADGLTGPPLDAGEPGAVSEAVKWLHEELATAPQPANDLKAAAKTAGISWTTIKRAKKGAGVVVRKVGFVGLWVWGINAKEPSANYWSSSPKRTNGHDAQTPEHTTTTPEDLEGDHFPFADGADAAMHATHPPGCRCAGEDCDSGEASR